MTMPSAAPTQRFDSPENVLGLLRARGLRISTARRLIVGALFATQRPLAAEAIAVGLRNRGAYVDLASVYRNLETLEQVGIVRHLHAGHGPSRYVLAGAGDREFIACERCGEVDQVEPSEFDAVRSTVAERFDFEVRFTHFPLVGICADCRREAAAII